ERRQAQQPRDEQLRERMNARTGRDLGNVQNRTHTTANTQRPENQSVDLRQTNRRIEAGQQQPRTRDERVTSGRGMQIDRAGNSQPNSRTHSDNDNNQINRNQLPRYQSEVRSEPIARVDRPTERVEQRSQPIAQVERREAPRAERVERIDRSERVERANSGMQHPGNRAEMRGGRER
ncbi:MAG TPA: hypothetical protein VLC79_14095, partial [Cellvibrio sp.]|nr:hypothetical protein [Cellvibrio sp.]